MKKLWQLGLMAILSVMLLTACGTATEDKPKTGSTPQEDVVKAEFPVTLTDAVGNDITLESAPKTIVSMMPSNTEILFELGLGTEVVGVNDYDDYPAEVLDKEKIGGMEFNVEKIVSMNPEIVFAHESGLGTGKEGLQQLRDAGIPVFVVKDATNFEETYETIEQIGKATGKSAEAKKIVSTMKEKVENIIAKTAKAAKRKTVFVETSDVPEIYTPGKNTFVQEILDMIGAENIVSEEGWVMIDSEKIVSDNPDIIVVMHDFNPDIIESVKKRSGFDAVTAVKENAIVQVDANLTSRTGPRLAEGLEGIAKAVYPEVFSE